MGRDSFFSRISKISVHPSFTIAIQKNVCSSEKKLQAIGIKCAMHLPATFSVEYIGSKMRFHSHSDAQDSLNSLEVNSEESLLNELGEMLDRLITREEQGWLSHSLGLHLANQKLLSHNTDSEMFNISTRVHLQNLTFFMSICKY